MPSFPLVGNLSPKKDAGQAGMTNREVLRSFIFLIAEVIVYK
jgi:hypothetical protein